MNDMLMTTENTKQFIVVNIAEEHYGIDIKYIDNIVRMQKITRVPKAQPYFSGVINLRGEIVPVMSLRRKMRRDDDQITNSSRIIILKYEEYGIFGVIVDAVKEVVTLSDTEIDRGAVDSKDKNTFINGVGKNGGELISLLDISSIIKDESF
jgi:purine-binding chemotaxis protein CheW